MWKIKDEIIRASKFLNISILKISQKESMLIIDQIIDRYAGGKKSRFLWENFIEKIGIKNKNAWRWIEEIISDEETIMFFNPEEETVSFKFCNGKDVAAVLSETFGFEFYLTNKKMDYVVCFNHHDVLVACGKAIERIKKYKTAYS